MVKIALSNEFDSIVKMFRFFVRVRNFSYIDRIGNALSYEPVEFALRDALRAYVSIYNSAEKEERAGRSIRFIRDKETGEPIYLPSIPSQEEVEAFLDKVREDIGYARRLAILALSIPRSS